MEKKWQLTKKISEEFKEIFPELNPIILQLLYNRGITNQNEIDKFLGPDYGRDLHNPFLFNEMQKAVDRIFQAIENNKKILIYGDYDADGVCATVLMADLLKFFKTKPDIYIPYREIEGYSLNKKAVKEIISKKIDLVITVDCGITNYQEIEMLVKNNIDVIITDHHKQVHNLPPAYAIINPNVVDEKYPFKDLSGCAVVFKLIQAMLSDSERNNHLDLEFPPHGYEKWFLDLVAISIVGDICDLLDENRVLVKYGLIVLKKTKRLGLQSLFNIAGINFNNIDTRSIGYQIAPRLNAAGRMDHASTSYQLLITQDLTEAKDIATKLNEQNKKRQSLTDKIYQEASNQLKDELNQKILITKNNNWTISLVGLVAGKLVDEFYRPVLLVGRNSEGKISGSGRSIENFDITKTLKVGEKFLIKYGGHPGACGFTLSDEKSYYNFKKTIEKYVNNVLDDRDIVPVLKIEAELFLDSINWQFCEDLEKFAPFGKINPRPIFLAKNVEIINIETVGQNGNHLRIMAKQNNGLSKKMIGFCFGDWCQKLKIGDIIDVVFELSINEWNGNREIQLKIIDLRLRNG